MNRPATYRPVRISDGIVAAAARTPAKVALEEGERRLTFSELAARMHRLANAFHALTADDRPAGAPGRLGLLMPNCLEFIEIVCGTAAAGGTAVPLNPGSSAEELSFLLRDSDLEVLIAHPSLRELVQELDRSAVRATVFLGDEYELLLSAASATAPTVDIEEWDPFCISYTGGTTGTPKGVVLSHRSRVLTFMGMGIEYGCYSVHDRALCVAPLFHGAGLSHALAPLFFGGYCRVLAEFEPERILPSLSAHGITNVFMVPTHFAAIFSLDEAHLARARDLPALKALISNAAPLSPEMKERIVGLFGPDVLFEAYGSTEGGTVTMIRPQDQLRKRGSVGLPFVCTLLRFMDESGEECPVGEVGELYSHSPYLFSGYLNRPQETLATLRQGWFSAGDLGFRDEEGYVYLVDRKDDKIISGGVNVFPREVEEMLMRHPAVADAAVFGVPDDYWGEAVRAAVVVKPGTSLSEQELLLFCREHLGSAKRPKAIEFHAVLPRTSTGKILRRRLRDPHWQGSERAIH